MPCCLVIYALMGYVFVCYHAYLLFNFNLKQFADGDNVLRTIIIKQCVHALEHGKEPFGVGRLHNSCNRFRIYAGQKRLVDLAIASMLAKFPGYSGIIFRSETRSYCFCIPSSKPIELA